MKTKTKSTVARRRVKRRQERVSHKKLRTLRSRKYARKTARNVMRGGAKDVIIIKFKKETGEEVPAIVLTFSEKNDKLNMSVDIDVYQGNVITLLHSLFNIYGWGYADVMGNFLLGLADYPEREATKECALEKVKKYYEEDDEEYIEVKQKINKTFNKIKSCDLEIVIDDNYQNKKFIQFTVKKYHRIKVGFTGNLLSNIRRYYPMVEYADPFIDGVTGNFVKGQGIDTIKRGCGVMNHNPVTGQNQTKFHVRHGLDSQNEPQKIEILKNRLRSIQYVSSEDVDSEDGSKKQIYKITKLDESNNSTTEVIQ
jgi:hypothetical protein